MTIQYTFDFGDLWQVNVEWRVWAVDENGVEGAKSDW
jgi:hypothetical protein